jgi:aldehyde:ferredoxin oxidoreductase
MVIEGKSERPIFLWASNGEIEILDAGDIWGLDTLQTERAIRKEMGTAAKVVCIGPAGENLVKFATIMNDGGRAVGRSGLGAVMGSKKLKAIAAHGDSNVEVANANRLNGLAKQMAEEAKASPGARSLHEWGTCGAATLEYMVESRNLPLKNWSQNTWDLNNVLSLSARKMADTILTKRMPCCNCPMGCERIVWIKEGLFAIEEQTRGPEYETLAALGFLCLNGDLEAVAKGNDLCNRFGLDTIEAGTVIAFSMECYENGILSKQELGMELKWGDGQGTVSLLEKIARRKEFGSVLAEGVKGAAEIIGKGAHKYAMHVKGSSICMQDPRVRPLMALKYAVGNVGAYHGKGCPDAYGTPAEIAYSLVVNQNWAEALDCLVMCNFAFEGWAGGLSQETYVPQLISAVTGREISVKELLEIGQRIYNMKRSFNTRLGITAKDDKLPRRFMEIPRTLPSGEEARANVKPMLKEYYKIRGWDKNGVPHGSHKEMIRKN